MQYTDAPLADLVGESKYSFAVSWQSAYNLENVGLATLAEGFVRKQHR